jgi:hypothetical protein
MLVIAFVLKRTASLLELQDLGEKSQLDVSYIDWQRNSPDVLKRFWARSVFSLAFYSQEDRIPLIVYWIYIGFHGKTLRLSVPRSLPQIELDCHSMHFCE